MLTRGGMLSLHPSRRQDALAVWGVLVLAQIGFVISLAVVGKIDVTLLVGIAVSPLLILAAFRWPQVVLALFLLASTYKAGLSLPVDVTLLLAVTLAIVVSQRWARDGIPPVPIALLLVAGVICLVVMGATLSDSAAYGADKAARLATLGGVTLASTLTLLREKSDRERFILALVILGALVAASAIAGFGEMEAERFTAFGSTTIALGRAAGVSTIGAALVSIHRPTHRWWALPATAISAWAMLGSGTRQALLGIVVAAAVVLLLRLRAGRAGTAVTAVAAVAGGLVLAASLSLIPATSLERVGMATGSSTEVRIEMAHTALTLVAENPVFGVGTGGFGAYSRFEYPHNIFLEVASENGVATMVLLVAAVIAAAGAAWRTAMLDRGFASEFVLAALAANVVFAMLSSDINGHRLMFALIAMALAAKTRQLRPRAAGT